MSNSDLPGARPAGDSPARAEDPEGNVNPDEALIVLLDGARRRLEMAQAARVLRQTVESASALGRGEHAGDNPAARMPGESYRDHAARLYGMYRALLVDVERLRQIEQAARQALDTWSVGDIEAARRALGMPWPPVGERSPTGGETELKRLREIEQAARDWADVQNMPRGRSVVPVAQALHDALRAR